MRPEHLNPHGVVDGAVAYALADYAMGGALTSVLEAFLPKRSLRFTHQVKFSSSLLNADLLRKLL